jgi:monoamine oxidase
VSKEIIKADIAIIGGGLTGLTLNYLLRNEDFRVLVIESRDRLGGRIYTNKNGNSAAVEMGATWLGTNHQHLNALLKTLDLGIFKQEIGTRAIYEPMAGNPAQLVQLPANDEPSYRIKGGTSSLIERLSEYLEASELFLNQSIKSIQEVEDKLLVVSENQSFLVGKVISTLPPNLFEFTIQITPSLSDEVQTLMKSTHTWMGDSIKIGLTYDFPFWKEKNTSGTIFSNVGPVTELYDHSNYENNSFALKGFLNSNYYSLEREERLNAILKQLKKYYGNVVENYSDYKETVWRGEADTYAEYPSYVAPHQNNGHSFYHQSYLNNKLYIGGSETSKNFPGYMEGAIQSASYIYQQIKKVV